MQYAAWKNLMSQLMLILIFRFIVCYELIKIGNKLTLKPIIYYQLDLTLYTVAVLFCYWFLKLNYRYSPDVKQEAPRWACGLCALGLFVYQSLDAVDGKQARRTGTSNPLGELFDHGCDSVSTVFVALSACIAVQLGYYPGWMFFQVGKLL